MRSRAEGEKRNVGDRARGSEGSDAVEVEEPREWMGNGELARARSSSALTTDCLAATSLGRRRGRISRMTPKVGCARDLSEGRRESYGGTIYVDICAGEQMQMAGRSSDVSQDV